MALVFNFNPYRAKIQPQRYVQHSIMDSAPKHYNKIELSMSGNINTVILTTAHVLLSPYCEFSGTNRLSYIAKINNDRICQRNRNFRCLISYLYFLKGKTENEYPETTGSSIA